MKLKQTNMDFLQSRLTTTCKGRNDKIARNVGGHHVGESYSLLTLYKESVVGRSSGVVKGTALVLENELEQNDSKEE